MVGIAFAGGSVRGAYEVGVYYAFKKCHIKVDGFVGTSIGSFNAAMLAAHKERELLTFWQNIDVTTALKLDDNFVKALKEKDLKGTISGLEQIVLNKGVSTIGVKEILEHLNIEKDLRKSKKDFGLVTIRIKPFKIIHIFKDDIPIGKLNEYILGSCYHPIFKYEKIIDEKYYIDGGFYDNMPCNMLLDKGYSHVYAVNLKAMGIKQRIKDKDKVTVIKPSQSLGNEFTFDKKIINNNIKMGYYDTYKILKKLDGKKYIFKKYKNYDKIVKNFSKRKIQEMFLYYKVTNIKDLIITVVESLMKKEEYDYFKVYNIKKVIKKLRRSNIKNAKVMRLLQKLNV